VAVRRSLQRIITRLYGVISKKNDLPPSSYNRLKYIPAYGVMIPFSQERYLRIIAKSNICREEMEKIT
jgi:hypothetical protein